MSIDRLLKKILRMGAGRRVLKSDRSAGEFAESAREAGKMRSSHRRRRPERGGLAGHQHLYSQKAFSPHFRVNLRCDCGYEGTGARNKEDLTVVTNERSDFAYFKCPKCKPHLQYDCLTGKIKTRRGAMGILLGKFS